MICTGCALVSNAEENTSTNTQPRISIRSRRAVYRTASTSTLMATAKFRIQSQVSVCIKAATALRFCASHSEPPMT